MLLFMYGAMTGAAVTILFISCIAINSPDYWKEERKHGESKDD